MQNFSQIGEVPWPTLTQILQNMPLKCADRQIRKLYKSQSPDSDQPWNVIDQDELQANYKLSSKGIKWKFIVERSPWRGGWWERLIRNVKEPLRKVLGLLYLPNFAREV